jgi:hypothetical protein
MTAMARTRETLWVRWPLLLCFLGLNLAIISYHGVEWMFFGYNGTGDLLAMLFQLPQFWIGFFAVKQATKAHMRRKAMQAVMDAHRAASAS